MALLSQIQSLNLKKLYKNIINRKYRQYAPISTNSYLKCILYRNTFFEMSQHSVSCILHLRYNNSRLFLTFLFNYLWMNGPAELPLIPLFSPFIQIHFIRELSDIQYLFQSILPKSAVCLAQNLIDLLMANFSCNGCDDVNNFWAKSRLACVAQ